MYKCKECGTEYEIKPDYCDCGNNTFEEILSEQQTSKMMLQMLQNLIMQKRLKKKKQNQKLKSLK